MLNRLISLVFLLSFLKISIVYSETDFLLPQKKPSIFKKSEIQIQENINKNLPAPKPLLEKKGETKPAVAEQTKELAKKKEIKTGLKEEVKTQLSSKFVYPRKKPITYKVSSKEVKSSKVLNKKDFNRGYIVRHFAQKVNDDFSPIIEISQSGLNRIRTNPLYRNVSLRWRLTGTPEEIKNSNRTSISEKLKPMPQLKNRLVNLVEYSKK